MAKLLLGCIADDFTGATDLANNLVRAGMRAVQTIGVPAGAARRRDADAVVVALKSRTIPPPTRWRSRSRRSLAAGAGRAADLLQVLLHLRLARRGQHRPGDRGADGRAAAGATSRSPDAGVPRQRAHGLQGPSVRRRRAAQRERHAPPPADADDRRQPGARAAGADAAQGRPGRPRGRRAAAAPAIAARFDALQRDGVAIAIVDAISNDDLVQLGTALAGMPLVTAGSGLAIGLPQNWRPRRLSRRRRVAAAVSGRSAVVSGSCSVATNAQVRHFSRAAGRRCASIRCASRPATTCVAEALAWADAQSRDGAGAGLCHRRAGAVQRGAGRARRRRDAGELVEHALAAHRRGLVERGVRQLVVAGGETSGAWCRRSASRSCASARRSTPACRGATARPPAADGDGCTWR